MYRLCRILFVLLALFCIVTPAPAVGSPLFLLHPESVAKEAPATSGEPALVVIQAKRYRLTYPLDSVETLPVRELVRRVDKAFARVEKHLGVFTTRIEMIVPDRIVPADPKFPKGLSIAGVCWKEEDGIVRVAVALGSADVDTFAHELFHARLRELNRAPPTWFEEGMAHFMESETGFNEEMFNLLKEKGPMKPRQIRKIRGVTDDELHLRATAWAMVYHLVHVEGRTLDEISRMDPAESVRPKAAWASVKRTLRVKGR